MVSLAPLRRSLSSIHTKGKIIFASFILVLGIFSVIFITHSPKTVEAANPTTLNFQGKVVNANGTNVTNGTYSFTFRLYNSSGTNPNTTTCALEATCLWEETQGSVTVTNGVFQVELGSSCPFFTANACNESTPIDFNTSNALYLTMKFHTDTNYMTPMMHFNSVPYAFNADKLGGIASSGFVQLSPGSQQTGNINISGSLQAASLVGTGALDVQSGAATALTVTGHADSTWSTSVGNLTLQGGSALILDAASGSTITIGNVASGNYIQLAATTRELTFFGLARHSRVITLSPEYAGATLSRDGTSTFTGTMTSDNSFSGGAWRNYYEWSSTQATNQDYTVIVRVTLPADFDGWETGSCPSSTCAIEITYQTGLAATTNNGVSANINHATETPGTPMCTIAEAASTSWTSFGCASSSLASLDTAGEKAVVRIKLKANSTASALARVGDITLRYKSKW